MKQLISILLCIILILSIFTACSSKENTDDPNNQQSQNSQGNDQDSSEDINNINDKQDNTEDTTENNSKIEGTLEDIMQKIYDNLDESVRIPMLYNTVMTPDMDPLVINGYIGTDEVKFTEGIASEPMINAIAHSVVLIRVEPNSDIENIKKLIKDNVNPRKWVCVGVDASNVVVDNIGDLVILIMSDDSDAIHQSFLALAD